jgi:hypothetical protein
MEKKKKKKEKHSCWVVAALSAHLSFPSAQPNWKSCAPTIGPHQAASLTRFSSFFHWFAGPACQSTISTCTHRCSLKQGPSRSGSSSPRKSLARVTEAVTTGSYGGPDSLKHAAYDPAPLHCSSLKQCRPPEWRLGGGDRFGWIVRVAEASPPLKLLAGEITSPSSCTISWTDLLTARPPVSSIPSPPLSSSPRVAPFRRSNRARIHLVVAPRQNGRRG